MAFGWAYCGEHAWEREASSWRRDAERTARWELLDHRRKYGTPGLPPMDQQPLSIEQIFGKEFVAKLLEDGKIRNLLVKPSFDHSASTGAPSAPSSGSDGSHLRQQITGNESRSLTPSSVDTVTQASMIPSHQTEHDEPSASNVGSAPATEHQHTSEHTIHGSRLAQFAPVGPPNVENPEQKLEDSLRKHYHQFLLEQALSMEHFSLLSQEELRRSSFTAAKAIQGRRQAIKNDEPADPLLRMDFYTEKLKTAIHDRASPRTLGDLLFLEKKAKEAYANQLCEG
ncbi:MAG: hypothetical protein M1831_002549 [Alyxoria varia]|nr:MAG: hypothetical protein M1831_002549 [Alyxoria varia]